MKWVVEFFTHFFMGYFIRLTKHLNILPWLKVWISYPYSVLLINWSFCCSAMPHIAPYKYSSPVRWLIYAMLCLQNAKTRLDDKVDYIRVSAFFRIFETKNRKHDRRRETVWHVKPIVYLHFCISEFRKDYCLCCQEYA
jgi:hypothetical protein